MTPRVGPSHAQAAKIPFIHCIAVAVATPAPGQTMASGVGPASGVTSGANSTPDMAAAVKNQGGERCGKCRDLIPSGVVERGERN
jgi:hypothetical protein